MADPLVCYLVSNNVVTSTNQYFPCGSSDVSGASAQACCNAEDYCMENSICHYTRSGVTNGTGYYMGGCTDPTWKDPACPKQCTSEFTSDIIYDRTSDEWRCCDSTEGTLDCQSPSDFIVKAPDPQDLSTIVQLSTAAPSSTAATSITAITSSPATTSGKPAKPTKTTSSGHSNDTDQSSKGLSTAAEAGIAFAIITLVVLLIGVFLFFRIRSAKPKNETKKHKSEESRTIPPPNSYRPSGAFTALSSQPNSALPSPRIQSPFDSRRDSEFPISLHVPETAGHKKRFSYETDVGPYEMEPTPVLHQRVPYERPLSAQELEGTKVLVQELPANHRESGLGIEILDNNSDTGTPREDSDTETPDKNR